MDVQGPRDGKAQACGLLCGLPNARTQPVELSWRVTVLQGCYGNVKPMNGPPPRDRAVSKCEIDSVVHRDTFKPIL